MIITYYLEEEEEEEEMGPSLSPQRAGELFAVELLNGHGDRDIAVANKEYANKLERNNRSDGNPEN